MTSSEKKSSQQLPVGIDLGTTYSVVAYVDNTGRPTIIPNSLGDNLTPSALLFEDGDVIVGKEAVKSSVVVPASYAECFKRDMGRDNFQRKVLGVELPPEVLSAFMLERLKEDAEARLGKVRKVVITVPAFFDETRRKATQDAGQLAGMEVLDIINEPTAAAVAYGFQQGFLKADAKSDETTTILVYDLGGGTFDVTILEINGNKFRAIATDGDVRLGGKDFDERLVNYLAEEFIRNCNIDPRQDPEENAQLWIDAQEAKHSLSERKKTTVVSFHGGKRMRTVITREQFEELTLDLIERSVMTTSLVVKQAGLTWENIDRVLLVGGSSRIPVVVDALRRLTGQEPDRSQSPDEAVAMGAALYAGMLMGGSNVDTKCELINVNSYSLGVVGIDPQTRRRTNVILIPKNTPLPHRVVKTFRTAQAGQRSVKVPVVEGESHFPDECIQLGECVVRNLPKGLPQGTAIEVEYSYAANGRISVSARVPDVHASAHVNLERGQNSGDIKDLEPWRKRLAGEEEPAKATIASTPKQPTPTPASRPPIAKPDTTANQPTEPSRVPMAPVVKPPITAATNLTRPAPTAPSPVAPTPVAPTPVAPTPVAPTPVAPTPVAPTPVAQTPQAPTPVPPTPLAPTPLAPTPLAPTPLAQTPLAPTPAAASMPPAAPTPSVTPLPTQPSSVHPAPTSDGQIVWQQQSFAQGAPAQPITSMAIVDPEGHFYVVAGDRLLAIREEGGHPKILWQHQAATTIAGSPVQAMDGGIRIHSHDQMVHSISRQGASLWTTRVCAPLQHAVPIVDRHANTWICGSAGGLLKIDPFGSFRSTPHFRTRQKFDAPGILHEQTIYVPSDDSHLYAIALDARKGENRWSIVAGQGRVSAVMHTSPARAADGSLVVCGNDPYVYAFGPEGALRWNVTAPTPLTTGPVIDPQGQIYVGTSCGKLLAIHPQGRILWQYEATGIINTSPVIGGDGTIYCADSGGTIHAINSSGIAIWNQNVGAPISSPLNISPPGRVISGLANGTIVALRCSSTSVASVGWPKFGGPNGASPPTTGSPAGTLR